jgi:AcrR family transcriptional regulator
MMSVTDNPGYDEPMARWNPGSRDRLHDAALELFAERGFEHTTVAEIAERAGVTERTYFRHFSDKREVLFALGSTLEEALVNAVAAAPASLPSLEVVAAGLEAVGAELPDRETARRRQAIIAANSGLRERDLMKNASMSAALAKALRARGLRDPAADITAEVGMAIFRIASERWMDDANDRGLAELIHEYLDELRTVISERREAAQTR